MLSMTCLNLPEQLRRRLYAGRGTEVVVPPSRCLVALPIAAASVMVHIQPTPVLPVWIMRPNRIGNAGLPRRRRVRPDLVQNTFSGLLLHFV